MLWKDVRSISFKQPTLTKTLRIASSWLQQWRWKYKSMHTCWYLSRNLNFFHFESISRNSSTLLRADPISLIRYLGNHPCYPFLVFLQCNEMQCNWSNESWSSLYPSKAIMFTFCGRILDIAAEESLNWSKMVLQHTMLGKTPTDRDHNVMTP